jgi:D-xylose transport system substrate-binding protein
VAALRAAGRGPIPLSGRSASLAGIRNVLSGWQTGTVYDSAKLQAGAAVRAAASVLRGQRVGTNAVTADGARRVPSILVRPVWITKGNYAALFAEGVTTRSELCSGEYARLCR